MKPFRSAHLNHTHPLARGLVGCWLLNEGAGKIVWDYSGNNNSGSLLGDAAFAAGRFGFCIKFDGNGDYVNLGNRATLQVAVPFTISAWVYINSLALDSWVVGTDKYNFDTGGKYYGCHLRVLSTGAVSGIYGAGTGNYSQDRRTAVTSTTPITTNQWYHIVAVCHGAADWTIAVNGINQPLTYSGSGGALAYSASPAVLGQTQSTSAPYWFNGRIDNCLIYNRALTAKETELLYQRPFCMFEPGRQTGHLLPVYNVTAAGSVQDESDADGSANIVTCISQPNLSWRQDALFNAATARAVRLGTVLSMGWFWNRPSGCLTLHRGASMDNIDYRYPLCTAEPSVQQLQVPAWVQSVPGGEYFYTVRLYNRCGQSHRCDSAAVKVAFDGSGELLTAVPNGIYNFSAKQIAGNEIEFRWYYNPLNQQNTPASFKLFWDAGSGQINFNAPLAQIDYRGGGFYSYIKIGGFPQRYLFALCAADAGGISGPPARLEILVRAVPAPQAILLDTESL